MRVRASLTTLRVGSRALESDEVPWGAGEVGAIGGEDVRLKRAGRVLRPRANQYSAASDDTATVYRDSRWARRPRQSTKAGDGQGLGRSTPAHQRR